MRDALAPPRAGAPADRGERPAVSARQAIAATVLVNAVIAAVLTLLKPAPGFAITLVYSQAIGLSICLLVLLLRRWSGLGGWPKIGLAMAAVPAGTLAGIAVGWLATGWPAGRAERLDAGVQALAVGLLVGAAVSALFALRERVASVERRLADEQLRLLRAEKAALEMELRLLQAQIEPHFLFNTLANVVSLIDTAPPQARALLEETIRYLRATLARARDPAGTLGQELAIVEAYLGILKMRLGERLAWRIEVAEALRALPCPPLLLQPLVENAVKHGIEPQIDGGSVTIRAERVRGRLAISVADTGAGLAATAGVGGVGLASVRERLAALYGEAGRLSLAATAPRGTVARVELPAAGPGP